MSTPTPTPWPNPDWPPPPIEERYADLVDRYLEALDTIDRIKGVLVTFYGAPLTLSSVQPVLDLAATFVDRGAPSGRV